MRSVPKGFERRRLAALIFLTLKRFQGGKAKSAWLPTGGGEGLHRTGSVQLTSPTPEHGHGYCDTSLRATNP